MAPVMVAFGVKFSDKVLTPAAPPATPPAATAPGGGPAATASGCRRPVAVGSRPVVAPRSAAQQLLQPRSRASSAGVSGSAIAAAAPPAGGAQSPPQVPFLSFKKPISQAQRLVQRPRSDRLLLPTWAGPVPKPSRTARTTIPISVFSVEDGLLHVSGEVPGVLETEKEYSDYWLTVEYKWGEKTWAPDAEGARRSAILLNIDGPDGAIHSAVPAPFSFK